MKSILFATILITAAFAMSNCGDTFSTVLEVDPPEFESKMTLSTFIDNQDSVFGFFVGRNRDIFVSGNFDDYKLDDASISITKASSGEVIIAEDVQPVGQFSFSYNYWITSSEFFVPGDEYTFVLEHTEFSKSETTLYFPALIDNLENISYKRNDGIDLEGDDNSSVTFEIVDDANTEDYYELEMLTIGGFNQFGTFWIDTSDPSATKGNPDDNLLFSDNSFNGERKKVKVNFDRWNYDPESNTTLVMKWKAISKDAYDYSKSARRFNDTDGTPFLSPVQIHSNVNDALGIISFKAVTEYIVE